MSGVNIRTNLRSQEQLDTVPVEIMAALSRLGPGNVTMTLDGPEAAWAGARLGLSGLSVERVTLHVRLTGGEAQP